MAELKVGDKIATDTRYGRGVVIHTIEKETPTMWVCEHVKFRKDGLRIVGRDTWWPFAGRIPSDADLMTSRVSRASDRISKVRVTAANIDAAEAFIAACATLPEPPK